MTNRSHFKCLALLSSILGAAFLCGCAIVSHGSFHDIKKDQVDFIQVGTTTEEDVLKHFGNPEQVIKKPNNVSVYIYSHGIERSIAIPFLISVGRAAGSGQRLSIYFKDGLVTDYEYMTDNRGITK